MTTAAVLSYAGISTLPSCLENSFYGFFGQQALFRPAELDCVSELGASLIVPLPTSDGQLVWLQESAIDDTLRTTAYEDEVDSFFHWLGTDDSTSEYQTIFDSAPAVSLVHHDPALGSSLVAVRDEVTALALSTALPRYWKVLPIPPSPIPFRSVPQHAVDHIRDLLATVDFDPELAGIVNGISVNVMRRCIRYLTNEDGRSGIESRHSFTDGSRVAAAWLKEQFELTGATCELKSFLIGFAPNVVCKYAGTVDPHSTVLISGHYDSRGSFGSSRAPGGNDDGSGTISLLAIAHRIRELGLKFRKNVELVAFAGEEQGLYGSKAHARELRGRDANVTLMIQADMLAYHAPNEPPQLGLPMYIGTPEVAELVTKIASIYSPELTVGYTAACCSDHQSFHEQGYAATQVFERAGPIADPMYHNSGDVSDRPGYDLEQVRYISKVQFATLLHAAGYDLPGWSD